MNKKAILKKYWYQHTLFNSLLTIFRFGHSRKELDLMNEQNAYILKSKLQKKYGSVENYERKERLNDTKQLCEHQVIWSCWLQGMEKAPNLVKMCHSRLHQLLDDQFDVITLTNDNYKEYVNLPNYIIEKYERGIISAAHFSDILRIEVLSVYGGIWVDATVYLSDTQFIQQHKQDQLFFYQVLPPARSAKVLWMSSWFIIANKNSSIINKTRSMLYKYWKSNDFLIDYFLFHYCFIIACEFNSDEYNSVVKYDNADPHLLQFELGTTYNEQRISNIFRQSDVHKLTYKNINNENEETVLAHLLKNNL
ncbi:capsular polysaccharide synthesis protein [Levilactobacillus bambusae]|uniref:Capsular biosynthesis protein n=1 Tax=Levilactobacillus bambusae TaxID=2024736 RepID=A0A2V1N085_9LACO|nr:capsular polysaccharide synthesis protein [Levilactobacillus bambusae]PWF99785.1 capsular biosynthesis protein [Levilactobacillus bambusae]